MKLWIGGLENETGNETKNIPIYLSVYSVYRVRFGDACSGVELLMPNRNSWTRNGSFTGVAQWREVVRNMTPEERRIKFAHRDSPLRGKTVRDRREEINLIQGALVERHCIDCNVKYIPRGHAQVRCKDCTYAKWIQWRAKLNLELALRIQRDVQWYTNQCYQRYGYRYVSDKEQQHS